MPFKAGDPRPPGAGRKPGKANQRTIDLKRMIEESLIGAGGVDYLREQARANPAAFLSLVKGLIPRDLRLDAGSTLAQILAESRGVVTDKGKA